MTEQMPVDADEHITITDSAETTIEVGDTAVIIKKTKLWPVFFGVLLLACATGAGGGWLWYQHGLDIKQINANIKDMAAQSAIMPVQTPAPVDFSALRQEIDSLRQQMNENTTIDEKPDVSRVLTALSVQVAGLQSRLQAQSDTSRDDWKLAEAEFLLYLANQRILLSHDSKGALELSQSADIILRNRNDPRLFSVRKILAEEILSLKDVEAVDSVGIYLRLQSIVEKVKTLNIARPFEQSVATALVTPSNKVEHMTVWTKIRVSLNRGIQTLGTYIRVRHHDKIPEPLLAPESAYYLQQNLRLMLEQAQSALLREEPEIYQISLAKADAWVEQYFAQNANTESVRESLFALQQVALIVDLPDVTEALRLLKIYINDLHGITNVAMPIGSSRIVQGGVQ